MGAEQHMRLGARHRGCAMLGGTGNGQHMSGRRTVTRMQQLKSLDCPTVLPQVRLAKPLPILL